MKQVNIKGLRLQAGVTILEFIAFIGLAALVIAGALGLYNSASSGSKSNELLTAATSVATSIRSVAAGSSGGTDSIPTPNQFTLPSGWAVGTGNRIQKQGNSISWANGATGTFTLTLTAQAEEPIKSLQNKYINGVSGTVSTTDKTVTWTNVPY